MSEDGATLVVRATERRDADCGVTRLSKAVRRVSGVLSGEMAVIEGSGEATAKVRLTRPGAAVGEMFIDADTRANADVKIGDSVRIERIAIEDARPVTLTGPGAFG